MNIYIDMEDELQPDYSINVIRHDPSVPNVPNANRDQELSSSDWANSVRTSQLDSSDESTLENTIEDISVMLPEMSRFTTTF